MHMCISQTVVVESAATELRNETNEGSNKYFFKVSSH